MNLLNKEIKKLPEYPFDRLRSLLANTNAKKTNFKNSKAMVKVYYNEGTCCTKKKYYVPNDNGTLWGVFTFNKDTGFTASDNMTTKDPTANP